MIQGFCFSIASMITALIDYGTIPNLGRDGWRYYLIVAAGFSGTEVLSILL